MNLDQVGPPTDVMARTLTLQKLQQEKKRLVQIKQSAVPFPNTVILHSAVPEDLSAAKFVVAKFLANKKCNLILPGRIFKVEEYSSTNSSVSVKIPTGAGIFWGDKNHFDPCLDYPYAGAVQWGIVVGKFDAGLGALEYGKIYRIWEGRFAHKPNFKDPKPIEMNMLSLFDVKHRNGVLCCNVPGTIIEPCHDLHIDNCDYVRCIDEADVPHAVKKDKIYKLVETDDDTYLRIEREDKKKNSDGKFVGINKKLFVPVYTENG